MTEQEARQAIIQDPTLVTDDRKFREHVVVKLAVLESEACRDRDDMRGIEKTLYGDDGKGGLVADVGALKQNTSLWFCVFRSKAATDSAPFRPVIPIESGHPFRSKTAT